MATTSVGEYLRETVYPRLDAVERNLLDELNPKPRAGSRYYSLDCPACGGKDSAFYYPGSGAVHCNRRNNCDKLVTPIWEILARDTPSKKAILERLCVAAGVTMPEDGRTRTQKTAASLAHDFLEVLREALWSTPAAIEYLRRDRAMTDEEIRAARIGYYPNPQQVTAALRARHADIATAERWEIAGDRWEVSRRLSEKFAGRIVGYWEQPDGSIKLWGRAFGKSLEPRIGPGGALIEPKKYEFQFGMVKTIPYRFSAASRRSALIAVEGALDAERMAVNGIPAIAIGGAEVIEAQAAYMASKGIEGIIHLTDGDRAGHNGAIKTIQNCEPLGISVLVAEVASGMDDPDRVIAEKGAAPINELLDHALSAGAFLVNDLVRAVDSTGPDYPARARRLLNLAERLTPASRLSFDIALKEHAIKLPDVRVAALRTMATLLELNVTDDEVRRILADRHGLEIHINQVKTNE